MRRLLRVLIVLALIGGAVFWWITRPDPLPTDAMAGLTGDAGRGREGVLGRRLCFVPCRAGRDG